MPERNTAIFYALQIASRLNGKAAMIQDGVETFPLSAIRGGDKSLHIRMRERRENCANCLI
jgi:hypothetical protein